MVLHFGCCPSELDSEQILDYLHFLKQQRKTPSESYFKHTVYGLRALFKLLDLDFEKIRLPSIERSKKLPVVLSEKEIKTILSAPKLLKHRLILAILYDCGLRCFELRNIKLSDVDFDRKILHIKKGKGRKDRYVPIGDNLLRGLKKYIAAESPKIWLFNGQIKDDIVQPYSPRGIQFIVREVRKTTGIAKPFTTHTFRHSYATHLLEMGLDIVSLKNLLGHSCIETTMVYLHVSQLEKRKSFSPLDIIFNKVSR